MFARQHSATPDEAAWLANLIASFWDFELVTSFLVEPQPERRPNQHWRAARLTDEDTE